MVVFFFPEGGGGEGEVLEMKASASIQLAFPYHKVLPLESM